MADLLPAIRNKFTGLILIISNIANEAAARLVDRFPPGAALLITASSFHQSFRSGLNVNDFSLSRIFINGKEIAASEIAGVITTISSFMPNEFYYIDDADQKYVCAEMNAFFIYFLSQLKCKKINPPTVRSLSGPSLHRIEWIKKVHAAGIPVWPVKMVNSRNVNAGLAENLKPGVKSFSALDGRIIGAQVQPGLLKRYAFELQSLFAMPFFSCHFISEMPGQYHLADIIWKPDVSVAANCEAIVNYFS